jgi:hypothetical protein
MQTDAPLKAGAAKDVWQAINVGAEALAASRTGRLSKERDREMYKEEDFRWSS